MAADQLIGLKVDGTFLIKTPIDQGSFGKVYKGINCQTDEEVAIKCERADIRRPQLEFETRLYLNLQGEGIPKCYGFATQNGWNFLITEHMGANLDFLLKACGGTFSLKTTLMLAIQMIERIQHVHERGYIHRDIKPENFLLGNGHKRHVIHLIDFGLSKKYLHQDFTHIPLAVNKKFVGTMRYTSPFVDEGIQASRRDDLISIAYILVYFLKGKLPWQGIRKENASERERLIKSRKRETIDSNLTANLRNEFYRFLHDTKKLIFDETPPYELYKNWFRECMEKEGFAYDFMYDWEMKS